MSQKKHKKRHPQQKKRTVSAPAMESEFASDGRRKRMNRTSRNLLLLSLVLVAAGQPSGQYRLHRGCSGQYPLPGGHHPADPGPVVQFRDPTGGGQSGVDAPRLR